ncbi:MAG: ribosome biogenesis GTPase Der [Ruminococcaceae bacterium]|nr:ribosome biogenesis GTPase Der [Oscillospiraceae bacterium]
MAKPVVAIVGRPNVGKSTIFNKIAGERVSIVEDIPGVTRDRIYYECEWNRKQFLMIDTGGIEPKTDDIILKHIKTQAEIAIDMADVIVLVTDVHTGVTGDDREISKMLVRSQKPVLLAVNKVDNIGNLPPEFYEFYELGFLSDPIPMSGIHGTGTGDLLDEVCKYFPEAAEEEKDDDTIKVAVIGKPNAGKSSIVNKILGENRLIVSDIAGTTRDAIDAEVENEHGKYVFIDTAGIRKQSKVEDRIEKFSVLRAKMAVERADVCLIMIDATSGVTEQDEKIAGLAHEAGKASIFVINKWDLIEKDNSTVKAFTDDVKRAFSYMEYAPVIFVSAKTGQRIDKLFTLINHVAEQSKIRVTTGMLNDVLADAVARVQPPSDKGRYLKIYYMTQTGSQPPCFVVFCNSATLFHFSYQRYLENCLRRVFGFEGTPIKLVIREKGDEKK